MNAAVPKRAMGNTEESIADLFRIRSWIIEINNTIKNQDTLDATFMEKYDDEGGEMIELAKYNRDILELYPDTCHAEVCLYNEFHDAMRILYHVHITIGVKAGRITSEQGKEHHALRR